MLLGACSRKWPPRTDMDRPTVRTVIEALLARMDEVVERCFVAVLQTVPSYERAGEPLQSDLREAVRDNVSLLARVIAQGREVSREELDVIERVGVRRAEAGIPLDDVLHAYRTVSRVCWDIVAEECRNVPADDQLDAAIALAEAVLKYTDQISTAVAEAYARAQRVDHPRAGRRTARVPLGRALRNGCITRGHTAARALFRIRPVAELRSARRSWTRTQQSQRGHCCIRGRERGLERRLADPIVLQKGEQTVALLPSGRVMRIPRSSPRSSLQSSVAVGASGSVGPNRASKGSGARTSKRVKLSRSDSRWVSPTRSSGSTICCCTTSCGRNRRWSNGS